MRLRLSLRWRLSLGLVLAGFLVASASLAITAARAKELRRLITRVETAGGSIVYSYQLDASGEQNDVEREPQWRSALRAWGIDLPPTPRLVSFPGPGELIDDALLADVAEMQSLREVHLSEATRVSERGYASLARLPELTHLSIETAELSEESAAAIGRMTKLENLTVWSDGLTTAGVRRFSTLVNLRRLSLDSPLAADGPALTCLAPLQKLEVLRWDARNGLTNAGLDALAAFKSLRLLHCNTGGISYVQIDECLPRGCKLVNDAWDSDVISEGSR